MVSMTAISDPLSSGGTGRHWISDRGNHPARSRLRVGSSRRKIDAADPGASRAEHPTYHRRLRADRAAPLVEKVAGDNDIPNRIRIPILECQRSVKQPTTAPPDRPPDGDP